MEHTRIDLEITVDYQWKGCIRRRVVKVIDVPFKVMPTCPFLITTENYEIWFKRSEMRLGRMPDYNHSLKLFSRMDMTHKKVADSLIEEIDAFFQEMGLICRKDIEVDIPETKTRFFCPDTQKWRYL